MPSKLDLCIVAQPAFTWTTLQQWLMSTRRDQKSCSSEKSQTYSGFGRTSHPSPVCYAFSWNGKQKEDFLSCKCLDSEDLFIKRCFKNSVIDEECWMWTSWLPCLSTNCLSLFPGPGNLQLSVDFLVTQWSQFNIMCVFLSLKLLSRIVIKGILVVLNALNWPRQTWCLDFIKFLTDSPWVLSALLVQEPASH